MMSCPQPTRPLSLLTETTNDRGRNRHPGAGLHAARSGSAGRRGSAATASGIDREGGARSRVAAGVVPGAVRCRVAAPPALSALRWLSASIPRRASPSPPRVATAAVRCVTCILYAAPGAASTAISPGATSHHRGRWRWPTACCCFAESPAGRSARIRALARSAANLVSVVVAELLPQLFGRSAPTRICSRCRRPFRSGN